MYWYWYWDWYDTIVDLVKFCVVNAFFTRIKSSNFVKMDDPNLELVEKGHTTTPKYKTSGSLSFYFYSSSLKKELIIFGVIL